MIHVTQAFPYDARLNEILVQSGKELGYKIHGSATLVLIESPRFSTLEESKIYQMNGRTFDQHDRLP